MIMLKHVLSLVLVLIKRGVLVIRERRAETRSRCLIAGMVAIRAQMMMAPRPSLPPIVGALRHRTHPLPFPFARLPLRRFLTARAPNLFTFLSQTPHVTSGEDDDAVATLRAATGLATPVIKDVLSRSGGFVEVAGDRAMREQEEWHDRERAREVQLQFDRAAIEPVQAETFTQVPLRANTRGASAGPPEQRPTSTKGNFSSSGSAPTAGGEQSSVTQTTTQPQRDEPGRGGRGGRGDGGHGGTSHHHGEPGGGRGCRGGGGRGGVDQRGGGGQRGGKPKASRGGGPVTRGGDG
mmetsp:Transcript_890/g.2460  ORF Transcript_890/g.2460 Transcript_890/m.2460 type:complete len:294 (-) Transcript_890:63-944(-)